MMWYFLMMEILYSSEGIFLASLSYQIWEYWLNSVGRCLQASSGNGLEKKSEMRARSVWGEGGTSG